MTRERPILFSSPMVRVLLDGSKTQTRRVVKPQPCEGVHQGLDAAERLMVPTYSGMQLVPCPYGRAGDRLWVRETFKEVASGEIRDGYGEIRYGFAYRADSATRWAERPTIIHDLTGQPPSGPMQFQPRPWKPSIHMPRRASRITLEITGARVERLQDISDADAIAEGCPGGHGSIPGYGYNALPGEQFMTLWDSINGPGAWAANSWVWVVEFRRVTDG